jgi:hypothetical protein
MLTGFPCPGCGITKSIVYFYDGNLLKSLTHHLFGPFVVIISVFFLVKFVIELKTKRIYLSFSYQKRKKIAYSIAALLIGYHIIRIVLFITNNSINSVLKESIWK